MQFFVKTSTDARSEKIVRLTKDEVDVVSVSLQ
jgi:hypothetical protein